MSLAKRLLNNKFISYAIDKYRIGLGRDLKFTNLITSYLDPGSKVLDLGCGVCRITKLLTTKGYKVTPIDIQNLSIYKEIKPVIFDGENIPFKSNSFDCVLILAVLHHTKNPEKIISEAKRVAPNIIIIEDVYKNKSEKFIIKILDSLYNLEFLTHPYNYKNDAGWRKIFKNNKLKVIDTFEFKMWGIPEKLYYLSK